MAVRFGYLWVALLLSLIGLMAFEVEEGDWEYLGSDVASLHRLKGLAHRFKHQTISIQPDHRWRTPRQSAGHHKHLQPIMDWNKWNKERSNHSNRRWNIVAKEIFTDLKHCPDFAECLLQKQLELNTFLETIEKKKYHDVLLGASELSYSYSNKVIVMLDDEAETLMRAEDEYSEDPHYSIKVTMSSLQSDLASLMVNRRTLFKVIGRNSKDGNSMSGYSGTSLAFHMITLGQVSLFSISGNVSRTFTRDFFRVFTRSGYINAVLETTVQNNHVYQIMTDTNACVEYQVSKRHVDHSTQYDTQQIVIMEDDPVVRNAATFLYEKHPTVTSVYMLDNQRAKLIKGDSGPLSAESRLVLVGHGEKGNDGEMRLSGYNAKEVAAIVEQLNIEENQIRTTSVVACDVGSDEAFRNTLFKELHARSINTELHLRNSLLEVSQSGQKHSAEMTPRGLVWKHGDGGKKIILKMNRNGEVVTQIQTTTHAEETFLNERNILGDYFKPGVSNLFETKSYFLGTD